MSIVRFSEYVHDMIGLLTFDGNDIVYRKEADNITFEIANDMIEYIWAPFCAKSTKEELRDIKFLPGLRATNAILVPKCCGIYPKNIIEQIQDNNLGVIFHILKNFSPRGRHDISRPWDHIDHRLFADALLREGMIRVCETLPVEFIPRLIEAIELLNIHHRSSRSTLNPLEYTPIDNKGKRGPYEETAFCEFTLKNNMYRVKLTPCQSYQKGISTWVEFSLCASSVTENRITSHGMCHVKPSSAIISTGLPALLRLLEVLKRINILCD